MFGTVGCGNTATPDTVAEDAQVLPAADAAVLDACSCKSTRQQLVEEVRYFWGQRLMYGGLGRSCLYLEPENVRWGKMLGGSFVLDPGPNERKASIRKLGVDLKHFPLLDDTDPGSTGPGWFGSITTSTNNEGYNMTVGIACIDNTVDDSDGCGRYFEVSHELIYAWVPPGSVINESVRCGKGILVGGSCSVYGWQDNKSRMLRAGMDPKDPNRWVCSWRSTYEPDAEEELAVAAQAFCLEEVIPESCGCCTPLIDSIVIRKEIQPLTANTNRVQVSCEPGEVALLGNCMLDGATAAEMANITMFRFGFPPGDHDTWGCSWSNPDGIEAQAIATALCIPE